MDDYVDESVFCQANKINDRPESLRQADNRVHPRTIIKRSVLSLLNKNIARQ